jgi:hypothetical protein
VRGAADGRAGGGLTEDLMLIFDQFPNRSYAEQFASAVRGSFGRTSIVCDSQNEADQHDPFPFELKPPIVLVERNQNRAGESPIEKLAVEFEGRFAGT